MLESCLKIMELNVDKAGQTRSSEVTKSRIKMQVPSLEVLSVGDLCNLKRKCIQWKAKISKAEDRFSEVNN